MKVFNRLKIVADQTSNNSKYQQAYWRLRDKYGLTDMDHWDQLDSDTKRKYRQELVNLKQKFNIKDKR